MATEYTEKRNFFRMNLDCNAEYIINGSGNSKPGNSKLGTVTDLSGDGISILADQSVNPGTEVRVCIKPDNEVTPPLDVVMEVVRCEDQGSENYLLAGNITRR